ncbi:MAG: RipA family octameric membrane protein [Planctomycetota bacterium]|jgi:hypothetical protein
MDGKESILLERYKLLHEATQAAHRYAWQMTSIFVPIIGGAFAFILKNPPANPERRFLFLAVILVLIWFWKAVLLFLDHCNDTRRNLLCKLEDELSKECDVDFNYYNEFSKKKAPLYKNFSALTLAMAVVLSVGILLIMVL